VGRDFFFRELKVFANLALRAYPSGWGLSKVGRGIGVWVAL